MVVAITIDARRAQGMLTGLRKTIPKAVDKGLQKLAKFGAMTASQQARAAGIKRWRGNLFDTLRRQQNKPRKTGPKSYGIFMPSYGIALDSMAPHWVALKRARPIRKWALDRGIAVEAGSGARPQVLIYPFKTTSVYVRPHPFIAKTNKIIRENSKKIVESEINKAIRRKGK